MLAISLSRILLRCMFFISNFINKMSVRDEIINSMQSNLVKEVRVNAVVERLSKLVT
jgi:hypothetical protein